MNEYLDVNSQTPTTLITVIDKLVSITLSASTFYMCDMSVKVTLVIKLTHILTHIQCESKNPLRNFLTFFPKQLGIFSANFTCLLNVPIYAVLQIFIQLPVTLTKLCHIKRDHHNVLKMSTIDRDARWEVALNMA